MEEEDEQEGKSRTQLKAEFQALNDLGRQLVELSPQQLEGIPLTVETREAILATKKLVRSALQRQFRYLARLIEKEDVDAIRSALSDSGQPHKAEVKAFHEVERWREELISGDEQTIAKFMEEHPDSDRRDLRQLVQNARKERDSQKAPKSARQLFRYLKSLDPTEG